MVVDSDEKFRREMNARSEQRQQKARAQAQQNKMILNPGAAKDLQQPGMCPICGVDFKTSASLPVGSPLKCHRCGRTFPKGS